MDKEHNFFEDDAFIYAKSALSDQIEANPNDAAIIDSVEGGEQVVIENIKEEIKAALIEMNPHILNLMLIAKEQMLSDAIAETSQIKRQKFRRITKLMLEGLQWQSKANTDVLMGINNRRVFDERLLEQVARSKRYGTNFSLLILDLDHFKQVNDVHGHPAGDEVLRETAHRIKAKAGLRTLDIPCRYGGEEIAIILPETNGEGACVLAQRLSDCIKNETYKIANSQNADQIKGIKVSVSIGVGEYSNASADENGNLVVKEADDCLYLLKDGVDENGQSLRGGVAYKNKLISRKQVLEYSQKMQQSGQRQSLPPAK